MTQEDIFNTDEHHDDIALETLKELEAEGISDSTDLETVQIEEDVGGTDETIPEEKLPE